MISLDKARALRRMIEKVAENLSDDEAFETPEFFANWDSNFVEYAYGKRVRYNGELYKCVQAHTSQELYTPDMTPALWTKIAEPGTIPVWVQPTGAQDAYMTGDRVHYPTIDDPIYVSTIDNNVWAPGVYGWELE